MTESEFNALRIQFEELRAEHDTLRQRPMDYAEHNQHIERLRAFTDALHAFQKRHGERVSAGPHPDE